MSRFPVSGAQPHPCCELCAAAPTLVTPLPFRKLTLHLCGLQSKPSDTIILGKQPHPGTLPLSAEHGGMGGFPHLSSAAGPELSYSDTPQVT